MNLCVTVEGSPRVNALPSSSSSTWPEMSNKSNPVSLLPHLVYKAEMSSTYHFYLYVNYGYKSSLCTFRVNDQPRGLVVRVSDY